MISLADTITLILMVPFVPEISAGDFSLLEGIAPAPGFLNLNFETGPLPDWPIEA